MDPSRLPQATEEPNWAQGSPADGRCPEAEQESKGTHVRKAEGPNWCSLCQAEGRRTLCIVNRGVDDRIEGWMEG